MTDQCRVVGVGARRRRSAPTSPVASRCMNDDEDDQRDRDDARAAAPPGRHHRRASRARRAATRGWRARRVSRLAHAAAACSATSVRKCLPGWSRPCRSAAQLVERAFGDQPAAGDDADAVGHALGDLEDVRGHDHGAAGGDALAQHVLDLARRAGVEAGQRLVENDQRGSCTSAPASATFCRMPLEKPSQRSCACGSRPSQPISSRARASAAAGSMPHRPATNSRYS